MQLRRPLSRREQTSSSQHAHSTSFRRNPDGAGCMQEDRKGDRVGWCKTQTDLGNCVGPTTSSGEERDVCDHAGEPHVVWLWGAKGAFR